MAQEIAPFNIFVGKQLGSGAFGCVCAALVKWKRGRYVMKTPLDGDVEDLQYECEVLKQLGNHSGITTLQYFYNTGHRVGLLFVTRIKWTQNEHGTVLRDLAPDIGRDGRNREEHTSFNRTATSSTTQDHSNENRQSSNLQSKGQKVTWSLCKGLLYSMISATLFSCVMAIVKYLDSISSGELTVLRYVSIFGLVAPLVCYFRQNPFKPKEALHFLLLRGAVSAVDVFLRFYAVQNLPIGEATVIIFSCPVVVSLFSTIFLKEPCGRIELASVAFTVIGVMLTTKLPLVWLNELQSFVKSSNETDEKQQLDLQNVSRSEFTISRQRLHGILAAVMSTLFSASAYIFIRKTKDVSLFVSMLHMGWVGFVVAAVLSGLTNQALTIPENVNHLYFLGVLCILNFCGVLLFTLSLNNEYATPVSVVRSSTDIALSLLWQLWLFRDVPDLPCTVGALLVILSIVLTGVKKWLSPLPERC